jgi:ATP-binding cassette subfamily C protein
LIKNLFFIFDILGKKNVIYLLILVPVVLLSIILEFFSIFSFLPLIMQSLGENDISSNYYLSKLSRLLISYFDNINFFFIFVLCVIATKNIYLLFQQYFFLTVTKKIYLFICDKMFVSRLSEKYLTFIDKSSSNFLKDIRETSSVFRLYLESLINFLTEIIISIVIVVFLFLINFNVSSIIFLTFGLILYLFSSFSKGYSQRTGQNQNQAVEQINDILLNSYHNFVDIRLYRQIEFFKKKFLAINSIYAECIKKLNFLFSIPKSTIELMIVTFLILFFFNFQEINFKDHIGILGIYLVAIYRLLPSAIKLSNLKAQLNSHAFSIKLVYESLKNNNENKKSIKNIKIINFKNVSFSYDKKNIVLKNLNLTFKKNQIMCIYGKSGCGKTTLVRLIAGLINPNVSGKIILDNKINYNNFHLDIGYVSQNFYIMKDSLINNIVFDNNEKKINFKQLDFIMSIVELKKIIESKNINYNSILKENASIFSGGQRQRIAIARALYRDTDILILDEATNALDLASEKRIIKNLHSIKKNKIIIIISHRKETKKSCDISYDLSK